MRFQLYNATHTELFPQVEAIATSYFTIDTASPETALGWYRKNPHCLVMATNDQGVQGYIDFIPLTPWAQQAIEERELEEQDITADHVLDMASIHQCRAIYFSGIAIRSTHSLTGARCVGALLSGAFGVIERVFSAAKLDVIYTNPTTFSGNRLARHIGFSPISYRKIKMGGMDLYMLAVDGERQHIISDLARRYDHLIIPDAL